MAVAVPAVPTDENRRGVGDALSLGLGLTAIYSPRLGYGSFFGRRKVTLLAPIDNVVDRAPARPHARFDRTRTLASMRPALSHVLGSSSTRALLAKAVRASATRQAAAASASIPHRLPTAMATQAATLRLVTRAPSAGSGVRASMHARARVTATPRKLSSHRGVVTARAVSYTHLTLPTTPYV